MRQPYNMEGKLLTVIEDGGPDEEDVTCTPSSIPWSCVRKEVHSGEVQALGPSLPHLRKFFGKVGREGGKLRGFSCFTAMNCLGRPPEIVYPLVSMSRPFHLCGYYTSLQATSQSRNRRWPVSLFFRPSAAGTRAYFPAVQGSTINGVSWASCGPRYVQIWEGKFQTVWLVPLIQPLSNGSWRTSAEPSRMEEGSLPQKSLSPVQTTLLDTDSFLFTEVVREIGRV